MCVAQCGAGIMNQPTLDIEEMTKLFGQRDLEILLARQTVKEQKQEIERLKMENEALKRVEKEDD